MGAAVEQLQRCGADLIHCDVMDGTFVPKITFGADMVASLKKHTSLPLDVHLMVVEPQNKIDDFIKAGADYLTFHYEACGERSAEVLRAIRSNGVKAGISVSPDTPVEKVLPLLEEADIIYRAHPVQGGDRARIFRKTRLFPRRRDRRRHQRGKRRPRKGGGRQYPRGGQHGVPLSRYGKDHFLPARRKVICAASFFSTANPGREK